MAVDYIRYDILTQEALRGVVRSVLADAAAKGLPGEHHFYVSIDTRAEGVRISRRLHAQYPEEITIVLQHQFWDLTVTDEGFEVGMSFNGIPERLTVPFAAITGFFDPSVQFGLQFSVVAEHDKGARSTEAAPPAIAAPQAAPEHPSARHEGTPGVPAEPIPAPANPAPTDDEPDTPRTGGEVVRLDRFRKK